MEIILLKRINFLLSFLFILFVELSFGQSEGDYRTREGASGNWTGTNIWQKYQSGNWVDVSTYPTYSDGVIEIRSDANITINSSITLDQVNIYGYLTVSGSSTTLTLNNGSDFDLVIHNGGTLKMSSGAWSINTSATWKISNGGTYIHNTTRSVSTPLNSCTIDSSSYFVYIDAGTAISYSNRTYGNLSFQTASGTWNCSGTSGANPLTVRGTLTIGSGVNWSMGSFTGTLNFNGNIDIYGTMSSNSFTVATGKTMTVYSGGTYSLNSSQTLTNNGTINISGTLNNYGTLNNNGTLNISSTGTLTWNTGDFSLGTTGTLIVDGIFDIQSGAGIFTGRTGGTTINGTLKYRSSSSTSYPNNNGSGSYYNDYTSYGSNGTCEVLEYFSTNYYHTFAINESFNNFTFSSTNSGTNYYYSIFASGATISGKLKIENTSAITGKGFILTNGDKNAGSLEITGGTAYVLMSEASGNRTFTSNGDVTISGGTLIIAEKNGYTGTLNCKGNFTHSGGTITRTNGTANIVLNGTTQQTITENGTISGTINWIINNSSGIFLGNNLEINNGSLTLTNGILYTGPTSPYDAYKITFGTSATNPSESSSSRIIGVAEMSSRSVGTGSIDFLSCNIAAGTDNIGNVTITRKTGTCGIVSVNGNQSIACHWQVTVGAQPVNGRDVTYSWLSDLDNGKNFSSSNLAEFWVSEDGNQWIKKGDGFNVSGSNPRTMTINTTSFSYWVASSQDSPLPVELLSFYYLIKNNNVILKWITSSEENNSGFEIQRNSLDKNEWEKIGFVEGKGTIKSQSKYEFTDRKPEAGRYKYRLKQIDYNGNFQYFDLSSIVEILLPDKFELSQNYPNPFNNYTVINISCPIEENVKLKIFDITGREVLTIIDEFLKAGSYHFRVNAENLTTGIYFYRLTAGKTMITKRMVLLK